MKILFISSEVAPFSKTGGLGDVAGALPAALAKLGHEVKVVTPLYATVRQPDIAPLGVSFRLRFPVTELYVELYASHMAPGHQVVLLHHPGLYGRNGVYGDQYGEFGDNHLRFGLLTVGALSACQALRWDPDVVHLNDWPTGLGAIALRRGYAGTPLARARTVFTIHNLAYQGLFPKRVMDELGLPWDLFRHDGLELFDAVNFLKAGVAWSDAITAVSQRYAQEIMTPDLGCSLDDFIRARAGKLHGILNGVDYSEWDPSSDRHLPAHFTPEDLAGKAACKADLRGRFALPKQTEAWPLYGIVSRLVDQKGVDLLVSAMHGALAEWQLNFIALGSGDSRLEHSLNELRARYPDRVGVYVGFDTKLSHLIEAGSDFFCMPSRYEPCGLNQMYSLRYGTVPIVRATGGLDDTVVDVGHPAEGTGIKFDHFTRDDLHHALWRGLHLYGHPEWLDQVRRRGMRADFSWERSAKKYESLYQSLLR
ncbi:MAG TPA: glycogen synthase GlgA [Myxococcaceae bacterium]|nr:glycogen synthase GlgA [Myxococcaceae bacterium]